MGPATPIERGDFVIVIAEAFRLTFEAVGEVFESVDEGLAFISRREGIYDMATRRGFSMAEISEIEEAVLEEVLIDQ